MADARRPRKKKAAPDAAAELRQPLSAGELRRQAEERLDGLSAASPSAPEELAAAVHELRVHQIELEMQNEELRRAQLELGAQREKYFELFDLAPVGYLTLSDEGIVGEANFTAAHLLGDERQQLVGQPFSAFVFAPDRDAYYLHLRKIEKSGAPQTCELRLQPVGGEPFWGRLEGWPRRAAEGEPLRYHLTLTDVHERILAEAALRESEEKYLAVYAQSPIAIELYDAAGRLVNVNPACLDLFGVADWQELRGFNLFADPNLAAEHKERLRSAETVRYQGAFDFEKVKTLDLYRTSRAGVIWLDVLITPMSEPRIGYLVQVQDITERKQAEEALARSARELHEQLHDTVRALGAIVGLRDPYTAAHERRVTVLAAAIAVEMGLGEEAREGLAFAAEVHDVGKVGVPAEILSKPGALSAVEYDLIKQHPEAGRELLGAIHFSQPVAEIVAQHQERMDGSGYPRGLKGEEILLEARILAVADVVEAMASHRPYRAALGLEAALAEVRAGAGGRYDAAAVAACERVFARGFVFTEP